VSDRAAAAIAGEAKRDAHELRPDFPIFQQHMHGKPLAYVSAVNAQKPRQVPDALRAFCESSYTSVHRGVYLLAERASERFEGSRETVRAFINACGGAKTQVGRGNAPFCRRTLVSAVQKPSVVCRC
jgi:hypothetical protein